MKDLSAMVDDLTFLKREHLAAVKDLEIGIAALHRLNDHMKTYPAPISDADTEMEQLLWEHQKKRKRSA